MLLLDTHTFVWLASDLDKLADAAQEAIDMEADSLFISGITGLEIALAAKRQRLILPTEPTEFIHKAMLQHDVRQIPVTVEIGCQAAALPDEHNDPFDRIIIATARHHGMTIISKDSMFAHYPEITVVW